MSPAVGNTSRPDSDFLLVLDRHPEFFLPLSDTLSSLLTQHHVSCPQSHHPPGYGNFALPCLSALCPMTAQISLQRGLPWSLLTVLHSLCPFTDSQPRILGTFLIALVCLHVSLFPSLLREYLPSGDRYFVSPKAVPTCRCAH